MSRESTHDLPILPLRDVVVYPHMVIPLFVGRDKSIKALDVAMAADKQILLLAQTSPETDDPAGSDLYRIGTLATVLQLLKLPDGTIKVLVEGVSRFKVSDVRDVDLTTVHYLSGPVGVKGAEPGDLPRLAEFVAGLPRLRLRGLMCIPAPDPATRGRAFAALRALLARLQARHPGLDTLSMGMSEDFEEAVAEGATCVRVGSALFGARAPRPALPSDATPAQEPPHAAP